MYSYKDIVRYSDVDKDGVLPLYGIMEYFQNCINLHSKEIGKSYDVMINKKKAWVLISWKIRIDKKLKAYDEIEVGTWAHSFDKMYGGRNYVILDSEGNKAAYADTKWILIDLDTRMPMRVEAEDCEGYISAEPMPMKTCSRKLRLSDKRTKHEPVKVLRTYIDTNGHMNNTAYLRLAEEYIPEGFEYNTMETVYVKETTEGMTMIPYVHEEENGIGISFEGEDGTVFTKIKLYLENE